MSAYAISASYLPAMGYELWALPLQAGETPSKAAYRLMAAEEARAEPDAEIERAKLRVEEAVVSVDPAFHRMAGDLTAIGAVGDAFGSGEAASLARTVELVGWPGVRIRLHDGWAIVDVASHAELATPEAPERLARVVTAIADETGWTPTDGERNEVADIAAMVRHSLEPAHEWARAIAELAESQD